MTTTTTKFRDVEIRAPRGTELTAKSWWYTVVLAVQHETGNVSTKL